MLIPVTPAIHYYLFPVVCDPYLGPPPHHGRSLIPLASCHLQLSLARLFFILISSILLLPRHGKELLRHLLYNAGNSSALPCAVLLRT